MLCLMCCVLELMHLRNILCEVSYVSKVCVIGHFGFGKNLLNGQTIKTKIVAEELEKQLGVENVIKVDLAGGIKRIPSLLVKIPILLKRTGNVVIMPVENGLMFLTPVLTFWNCIYKRKIHYVVIGGWLSKFLSEKRWLLRGLKNFRGIYAETSTMCYALKRLGLENTAILPNCKKLKTLQKEELVLSNEVPYRLCTFSRVMKEKGIETAVKVVQKINEQLGYTAYSLDIYGQVWEESNEWFECLQEKFPPYVCYCGSVDADKSVEVLKQYYALLFPTHFYTEGIPGTIIDAYAAGIPVVSSKWESYADVVEEGRTGFGYSFDNEEELENILINMATTSMITTGLKENCLNKAKEYLPEHVIASLIQNF